jgi:hypothetical protein
VQSSAIDPELPEVVEMCHDWWMRRERRREERLDEEIRYLLDEREHTEPPAPVVEFEREKEPAEPERPRFETGTRA